MMVGCLPSAMPSSKNSAPAAKKPREPREKTPVQAEEGAGRHLASALRGPGADADLARERRLARPDAHAIRVRGARTALPR